MVEEASFKVEEFVNSNINLSKQVERYFKGRGKEKVKPFTYQIKNPSLVSTRRASDMGCYENYEPFGVAKCRTGRKELWGESPSWEHVRNDPADLSLRHRYNYL